MPIDGYIQAEVEWGETYHQPYACPCLDNHNPLRRVNIQSLSMLRSSHKEPSRERIDVPVVDCGVVGGRPGQRDHSAVRVLVLDMPVLILVVIHEGRIIICEALLDVGYWRSKEVTGACLKKKKRLLYSVHARSRLMIIDHAFVPQGAHHLMYPSEREAQRTFRTQGNDKPQYRPSGFQ